MKIQFQVKENSQEEEFRNRLQEVESALSRMNIQLSDNSGKLLELSRRIEIAEATNSLYFDAYRQDNTYINST